VVNWRVVIGDTNPAITLVVLKDGQGSTDSSSMRGESTMTSTASDVFINLNQNLNGRSIELSPAWNVCNARPVSNLSPINSLILVTRPGEYLMIMEPGGEDGMTETAQMVSDTIHVSTDATAYGPSHKNFH
jgi:hypothetical protein